MPELYRFWGRHDPRGRAKPPIVAAVPDAAVDEAGTATLRLYSPVDSWGDFWGVSAQEFLAALDQLPDARQINLHINSPGGEVYEAIAITNALRAHPARVTAIVDGIAASAASFIAAACDELVMARNTELMIHDAWGIGIGPAADMRDLADRLDAISNNIASIYQAKGGGTVTAWRDLMLAETWMSADEAVSSGLADRVDAPAEPADPADGDAAARAQWDLSIFRSQGRSGASPPQIVPRPRDDDSTAGGYGARYAQRRHQLVAARHGLTH